MKKIKPKIKINSARMREKERIAQMYEDFLKEEKKYGKNKLYESIRLFFKIFLL